MRFLHLKNNKNNNASSTNSDYLAISEAYHLKAIETACTFINCKCPFISHLILNYQKNFNANLESIVNIFIYIFSQKNHFMKCLRVLSKKDYH
jgi:hypothetical protein